MLLDERENVGGESHRRRFLTADRDSLVCEWAACPSHFMHTVRLKSYEANTTKPEDLLKVSLLEMLDPLLH
jgi:hypothetical protein